MNLNCCMFTAVKLDFMFRFRPLLLIFIEENKIGKCTFRNHCLVFCTSMICQPQRAGNLFMPMTSALPTKHASLKISTPPSTLTLIRSANFVNAGECSGSSRGLNATRTRCRDKPSVSTTWVQPTETSVRYSKSSEMWKSQMCRISVPMGRDRITCLPLRREPPDHKAHCGRGPTHCIPWRTATSTRSGSRRSGMVIETVCETVRVLQTNNNNNNNNRTEVHI